MSFLFSVKLFSSTTNVGGERELDDNSGMRILNEEEEGEEKHTHRNEIYNTHTHIFYSMLLRNTITQSLYNVLSS